MSGEMALPGYPGRAMALPPGTRITIPSTPGDRVPGVPVRFLRFLRSVLTVRSYGPFLLRSYTFLRSVLRSVLTRSYGPFLPVRSYGPFLRSVLTGD
eukprot:907073-Rhodomonas_salina.1